MAHHPNFVDCGLEAVRFGGRHFGGHYAAKKAKGRSRWQKNGREIKKAPIARSLFRI
jgi:hypothetical protein